MPSFPSEGECASCLATSVRNMRPCRVCADNVYLTVPVALAPVLGLAQERGIA